MASPRKKAKADIPIRNARECPDGQAARIARECPDYAVTIVLSRDRTMITMVPIAALYMPHFTEAQRKLLDRLMEMMAVGRRKNKLTPVGSIPELEVREVIAHMEETYPNSSFELDVYGKLEGAPAAYRIKVDRVGSFF